MSVAQMLDVGPLYAAWSNGAPVRRVITAGNPFTRLPPCACWDGVWISQAAALSRDAMLYGDGWVDMAGYRVDPATVVLERTE